MQAMNPADLLAFEAQWWQHAGAKERAIWDTFGLSATRYYQVLNLYIQTPAALEQDAGTVRRLVRARSRQRPQRLAG